MSPLKVTELIQQTRCTSIHKYEDPTCVGDVWKVLGLLGYYRQSLKDFSSRAKPLYDLLPVPSTTMSKEQPKKSTDKAKRRPGQLPSQQPIIWKENHQQILNSLIDSLMKPPVMAYPDFSENFFLTTDASQDGLGAVLYQRQDGKTRVIAFGSRTLTPAEKNYHLHSGKLEFLALKWAITDKFRPFIYRLHGQQPLDIRTFNGEIECNRTSMGGRIGRLSIHHQI